MPNRSILLEVAVRNHGHLHVVLTEVAYLTRTNTFFDIPVHPGVTPVHANGATAAQIVENICLFNQLIGDHLLYTIVSRQP